MGGGELVKVSLCVIYIYVGGGGDSSTPTCFEVLTSSSLHMYSYQDPIAVMGS